MQRRRIEVRSQLRARLRALRLGHLWARSCWFGCRWGKPEGRLSSLPNEMRTTLGLLDVGSTWFPFPEVARNILRSEEHTSELQSLTNLVCRLLLEKKK